MKNRLLKGNEIAARQFILLRQVIQGGGCVEMSARVDFQNDAIKYVVTEYDHNWAVVGVASPDNFHEAVRDFNLVLSFYNKGAA